MPVVTLAPKGAIDIDLFQASCDRRRSAREWWSWERLSAQLEDAPLDIMFILTGYPHTVMDSDLYVTAADFWRVDMAVVCARGGPWRDE